MANTDMLTRNTLSRILGVENRTIQYWERKGLKSVRKNLYVMYRQQGFTIREIAKKMDRSESSIKYKLYGREKSDGRS